MPVEEHLEPNEVVIASSGFFYATDRRLLRYERAPMTGPQADSLEYGDIQSIDQQVQTRYRLVVISLAVFLLGLVDPGRVGGAIKLAFIVVGLGGMVYAILGRKRVWVFKSDKLPAQRRDQWRLPDDGSERTRRLVQVIQARTKPVPPSTSALEQGRPEPQPQPGKKDDLA
ncbi:MAG: hypothetical protein FJ315_00060 [SAR202 cluster bacterium]|nr:hypothetical protein [SAR202 cluster bacterium]